jgi:hypothetical protein
MVRPDALSAKHTLAEIPDNKRIGFLRAPILGHGIEARLSDAQPGGHGPKLTTIPLIADNA